jgi:hypothetical protein
MKGVGQCHSMPYILDFLKLQVMDTDSSGGLDSREFCVAMKKLVRVDNMMLLEKDDDHKDIKMNLLPAFWYPLLN